MAQRHEIRNEKLYREKKTGDIFVVIRVKTDRQMIERSKNAWMYGARSDLLN